MFLIGTWGVLRAVLALDEAWNKSLMHSSYFSDLCAPILISMVLLGIHSNSTDSEGSIERILGVIGVYNEKNVSKIRADVSQLENTALFPPLVNLLCVCWVAHHTYCSGSRY